jgi:hypothetical protein
MAISAAQDRSRAAAWGAPEGISASRPAPRRVRIGRRGFAPAPAPFRAASRRQRW